MDLLEVRCQLRVGLLSVRARKQLGLLRLA